MFFIIGEAILKNKPTRTEITPTIVHSILYHNLLSFIKMFYFILLGFKKYYPNLVNCALATIANAEPLF